MATIQVGYLNILETADSVTSTSTATNYSVNRLYDRDFGKLWISGSATLPQVITINQTTSPIEINYVVIKIIPKTIYYLTDYLAYYLNDYLSDYLVDYKSEELITYSIDYSANGSSWTSIATLYETENTFVCSSIANTTANYWRLSQTSSNATMVISELYLTKLISFTAQPKVDLNESYKYNSKFNESKNGISNFISYPVGKRKLDYSLVVGAADKTYWQNVQTYFDTYGPFFFIDHEGNKMIAELTEDLVFSPVSASFYNLDVSIQEVI